MKKKELESGGVQEGRESGGLGGSGEQVVGEQDEESR